MRGARAQASVPADRLLWMAAVLVGASLPHWFHLSIWVPALLSICIAWRLAASLAAWPLPKTVLRLAFAVIAFSAVLLQYHTINGLEAGSALLIVMVALKFLESHTHRDQLVLMMIAYFLVFASLLYPHSLLAIAYLLGFVLLTTVGLLQLGRRGPLLELKPTIKLAAKLLMQAVPIMIVLFVLFPRLPGPLWAMPGMMDSGRSGLDDEMSPGDLTELGLSEQVAFRVEFPGRPPRADQLYWRGPVLTNFNGRTWSRDPGMRRRVDDTLQYLGEPIDYRVMLEPHGRRWIFALDMPQRWPQDQNIFMNGHYQLLKRFSGDVHSRLDYRVTSYPEYRALEVLSESEREIYRRLPDRSNPRTRALAAGWLTDELTPREIIGRALAIFRDQRFFYTLTPPPLGSHPADEFLFETKEGFCEHYASAFTVLMRAAGLPARVVTGYQGGELNPLGSYYIIRQSEAHAWTEVWLEQEGWVRVDPTGAVAPSRIQSGSTGTTLARRQLRGGALQRLPWVRDLVFAWDAANNYWNQWVLGYNPQLQRLLLESLGVEEPRWTKLATLALTATALLLAALTAYLGWSYRQRNQRDPAARHFKTFCRRLARRVPPPAPSEGPIAFGRRAALALPNASGQIERIVRAYLKARYEPDRNRAELQRLGTLVKGFRPA